MSAGESLVRPPRIAAVGAGLIGRRHIELLATDTGCELGAIVDPATEAASLADAHQVPHYRSLDDLLAADRVDGVIVATPNSLHVPQAVTCIEAGTAVLVEKPMAEKVDEAKVLIEASEATGVPLLVGHHRRHSPLLAQAREVVASGQLGRVVSVTGSAVFYKPDDYFAASPWRREAGGGPILVNLIHEIDGLRFICGDIDRVQAVASNSTRESEIEDTVAVILQFSSGALGTFMLSDAAVSPHSWEHTSGEDPSFPHYPGEDCYVIAGTRGALSVPTMRLRRQAAHPSWWSATEDSVVPVARTDPLSAQLQHFCGVIRGSADPVVSGRDAAETLRVTRLVAEAAQRNSVAA